MDTEEEAQAAIAALDGYGVRGSHIHVEVLIFFNWRVVSVLIFFC